MIFQQADINVIPADCHLRIKALREQLGLTQEQMAGIMGVSFGTVNRWENEKVRPSFLARQKILLVEQLLAVCSLRLRHTPPPTFQNTDPFGKLLFHAKGGVVIDEKKS